jgi:ubiquinone/menaquinone biosynthesis C-methylase UbiE
MIVLEIKTLQEMINAENTHPWYRSRLTLVKIWGKKVNSNGVGVDIGCGSGAAAQLLQDHFGLEVQGFDISEYAVKASQQRGVKTIKADVTQLDLPPNSQDFAISLDVIEHIEDRNSLPREIFRILKPGGKCLITVPAHMWLWSNHDLLNHHFRRYSKSELLSDLKNAGFEVKNIRWWNSIFLPYILLTRSIRKDSGNSEFEAPPKILQPLVWAVLNFVARSELVGKLIGVSLVAEIEKPYLKN